MTGMVRRVLVVGGGTAGSVAALALRQQGVEVVLVEKQTNWTAIGHGITIQGNALRAFDMVGIGHEVVATGFPMHGVRMLEADGTLLQEIHSPPLGGPELPPVMGSMRPRLQAVLSRHVLASGVDVRLGTSITAIHDDCDADGAVVTFTDGTTDRFELVVGADGVHSTVRSLIGIDAVPQRLGMAIWRLEGPRPRGMSGAELYYGGPRYKAGYTPTGADRMYAYVIDEDRPVADYAGRPLAHAMAERTEGYGGLWPEICASIDESCAMDYRSLDALLLDEPWYRGRVLLIGDAAHACPPMLAQGAAMAAEDGVVLAELVAEGHPVEQLLELFMGRRGSRASMVVRNSVQLARWEIDPATPGADPAGLMAASMAELTKSF
ncbi:FAD-dependent monooxygenase [Nocardia sp. NPDC051911]|uniref:FAD-dependent monooxygenase n=1 Tax=Nocardia sp. NPDC051911 TaxID=3154648 RepID=UPI00343026DB